MAENKPLVSVLISLYNVERFVRKTMLADVLGQTYCNLEIILVDDGSTDSTLDLCGRIASQDSRVKVIHKENGGLGSARNAGLDAASGEYVYFCDVDDTIRPNLVEYCVENMMSRQVDMMIFGFGVHYDDPRYGSDGDVTFTEREFHNNADIKPVFVDELLLVPGGNGFAWNKFYRRDFIERNHFRFGGERIQQDEMFNMRIYPVLDNLYVSPAVLYDYVIYQSGNNAARFIPNRFEIYRGIYHGLTDTFTAWGVADERTERYVNHRFYTGIKNCVFYNAFHNGSGFSRSQRKQYISDVLIRDEVKRCLDYVAAHSTLNCRGRMALNAMRANSHVRIALVHRLEGLIAAAKRILK